MELDFSWLNSLTGKTEKGTFPEETEEKCLLRTPQDAFLSTEEYKNTPEQKKLPESPETAENGISRLRRKKEQYEADHKRSIAVYHAYQENNKRSTLLQSEIRKGVRTGEDIYNLFLKAVEAVSLMTDNPLLYEQVRDDVIAIHGEALLQETPLKWELDAVQERLERLQGALDQQEDPEGKRSIQAAINAHRAEEKRLQEMLIKENKSPLAV